MKRNDGPTGRNKLALQTQFATNLRTAMGETTCTLLASKVGISIKRISTFRQGDTIPSFAEFIAIAKALGCHESALTAGLADLL